MINSLTIDVEEWYQTELFNKAGYGKDTITNLPQNIYEILSFLDEYNTRATFFIVGSLAEKYPQVVKTIVQKGHEIASHGYSHTLVFKKSEEEFKNDVKISLDILKRVTGKEIFGYRAPTWSVTPHMRWVSNTLKTLGLKYDSSIYPFSFNLFKTVKLVKFPYEIRDGFMEFPPSTFKFCGFNIPFAGGTFLRFFSLEFIRDRILEINKENNPAMIYFHSWEFDEDPPAIIMPKWKNFIQYGNLNSVKNKIRLLLKIFKFTPIREVFKLN